MSHERLEKPHVNNYVRRRGELYQLNVLYYTPAHGNGNCSIIFNYYSYGLREGSNIQSLLILFI